MSFIKPAIHTLPYTVSATAPMTSLSIDTLHMSTPDQYGNAAVVSIIDDFSRFIQLYAVKGITADAAARALLTHFGIFGCPETLRSDNGTEFVNDTITALLTHLGTEHALTIAHSKEENGIIER
jgi:transposase InsO family protein